MQMRTKPNRWILSLVGCVFIVLNFIGCSSVGPSHLSRGRAAYNEVLTETNAEQSLAYIVKMRYGVLSSMLSVASITANIRIGAKADVNIGVGPSENYAGNLVPLSGGFTYEENPTISYIPVEGQKYLSRLMSPVSINLLIPLMNSFVDQEDTMTLIIERINQIPNPDFLPSVEMAIDDRFAKLAKLMKELSIGDALQFIQSAEEGADFYLWIHNYAPYYTKQVKGLLEILNINDIPAKGEDIFLPVSAGRQGPTSWYISIHTRSILRLAKIFAATVDVPEEDYTRGLTVEGPPLGLIGKLIKIRRSQNRPENTVIATKYRNWWYYIDGGDQKSKLSFAIFQSLFAYLLTVTSGEVRSAPVLTVPVAK